MLSRVLRILSLVLAVASSVASSGWAQRSVHVRGYTRRDGTYVAPHDRAAPGSGTSAPKAPPSYRPPPAPRPPKVATGPVPSGPPRHDPAFTPTQRPPTATGPLPPRDSRRRFVRSSAAKQQFMTGTGFARGRPGYVVDHIVPLACGGPDAPSNMQWQTVAEAKAKDRTERAGCTSGRSH
jgi:hypothetical protein